MPAVQASILVNAILDAVRQSGGTGIYVSAFEQVHPREFKVNYNGRTFSIWIYIWTLTHGGRPSLPHEYRIQMTSVTSPLQLNPDGYTVLLGYYHDLKVFAGFDLRMHQTFTTGSPSVQIDIDAIHSALQNGLGFSVKDNLEVAIGIRPDHFLLYVTNTEVLHQSGGDASVFNLLRRASESRENTQQEIAVLPPDRRTVITTINRYARDANFRQQVLNAYDNRCAVMRMQLKLIDAAHIVPIPATISIDHVTNGIALSPTMHRAFDNSLIFLDEDYYMRLNERKVRELRNQGLQAGLSQIRGCLNRIVYLPADRNQWPNPTFIKEGNKLRRIPGYYQ